MLKKKAFGKKIEFDAWEQSAKIAIWQQNGYFDTLALLPLCTKLSFFLAKCLLFEYYENPFISFAQKMY